jgi:hypothetical protein
MIYGWGSAHQIGTVIAGGMRCMPRGNPIFGYAQINGLPRKPQWGLLAMTVISLEDFIMELKICEANIYYEIIGEGKPVVMVHGWGCNPPCAADFGPPLRGTPRPSGAGALCNIFALTLR